MNIVNYMSSFEINLCAVLIMMLIYFVTARPHQRAMILWAYTKAPWPMAAAQAICLVGPTALFGTWYAWLCLGCLAGCVVLRVLGHFVPWLKEYHDQQDEVASRLMKNQGG